MKKYAVHFTDLDDGSNHMFYCLGINENHAELKCVTAFPNVQVIDVVDAYDMPIDLFVEKRAFTYDELVSLQQILERKKQGQNCTEQESAVIKQYFKFGDADILYSELISAFPQEFNEAMDEINNFVHIPSNHRKTRTADEIVNEISEVLSQWDGKDLERIANKILSQPVKYLGDSTFESQ